MQGGFAAALQNLLDDLEAQQLRRLFCASGQEFAFSPSGSVQAAQ